VGIVEELVEIWPNEVCDSTKRRKEKETAGSKIVDEVIRVKKKPIKGSESVCHLNVLLQVTIDMYMAGIIRILIHKDSVIT